MATKQPRSSTDGTQNIAILVLGISGIALIIFGIVAIWVDRQNTMTIFNSLLPVVASWVGTILAFYFGRRNFEAAGELAERLSPVDQASMEPIANIMRPINEITYFTIPENQSEKDVPLSKIAEKFSEQISRVPVLTFDKKILYMIHKSRVDEYESSAVGGKLADTLDVFIDTMKKRKIEFDLGKGFALVSEKTSTAEAKQRIDTTPAQDVFITKTGKPDEPVTGWVSNTRLCKYLEA